MASTDGRLTTAQVAALFHVGPSAVVQWADSGILTAIRTLGGHRRYDERQVRALLAELGYPAAAEDSGAVHGSRQREGEHARW